ncbi:hypothetical protein [Gordonia sp. NPDC127522]|uniref:hypothetical protein n=1 Tax=Gordonia sp. NPDC127522 TaxID=3345390 RepID=UPI0036455CE7
MWVSSEGDHSSQRPARFWAQLLGLGDAEQGVRVVGANLRELERRGFISLERAGENEPPIVRLLNETLTREPYTVPALDGDSYFRIPETLWTSGALARLDGPSLAIYLILLYYYRPGRPGVWFSPPAFHAKHGLSEATRLKGIAGLEKQGIITTSWEPVDRVGGTLNRTYRRRRLELTPQYAPPASFGRPVERSTGT